jgi:hypothetical protein
MTTPAAVGDGVERAVDAVAMALAKAQSRRRPVSAADIEDAVMASYIDWAVGEVVGRLGRGKCGDDCALVEGMEHAVAVMGRVVIEHISIEMELLSRLSRATGVEPVGVLRELLDAADRG